MQPIKAVFFDLDGTLIDSIDHIVDCWQHTFRTCLGVERTRDEITPMVGRSLIECMEEVAPGRAEELRTAYRERQQATHDTAVKVVPGTQETLEALRQDGILLGVVTSKGIKIAREGLALFDLEPYFDTLVTHEDTERHKPYPDPLLVGCNNLGIEPAHSMYIGDAVFDIQAGKRAGTSTAGVTWGAASLAELEAAQPDHIFTHMLQLLELFTEKAQVQ